MELKQAATAHPGDSRDQRLAGYSIAAAASALAVGLPAGATVIYPGEQNILIEPGTFLNLDLNADGNTDISLRNYLFPQGPYQGAFVPFTPGRVVGFTDGLSYASVLSEGDVIDADTTSGGPFQASLAFGAGNPNAEFNDVEGGFLGLAFAIGSDVHFGWVRVDIDNANAVFNVVDFAYESVAGVGITAGAIPEPSTLGLLAAGAAGLAARRRRRVA